MKTQYRNTATHRYTVGYSPDYLAYRKSPHLFLREPYKYWIGVEKLPAVGAYDTLIQTNCSKSIIGKFEKETSVGETL